MLGELNDEQRGSGPHHPLFGRSPRDGDGILEASMIEAGAVKVENQILT
jgi:hypothetical protein